VVCKSFREREAKKADRPIMTRPEKRKKKGRLPPFAMIEGEGKREAAEEALDQLRARRRGERSRKLLVFLLFRKKWGGLEEEKIALPLAGKNVDCLVPSGAGGRGNTHPSLLPPSRAVGGGGSVLSSRGKGRLGRRRGRKRPHSDLQGEGGRRKKRASLFMP